jgi:hypothetical protein
MPQMSSTPPQIEFPVACPRCRAVEGYPRGVRTDGPGRLLLDLRCESCGEVWFARRDSPELMSRKTASGL